VLVTVVVATQRETVITYEVVVPVRIVYVVVVPVTVVYVVDVAVVVCAGPSAGAFVGARTISATRIMLTITEILIASCLFKTTLSRSWV
jgi:hypothetical protein